MRCICAILSTLVVGWAMSRTPIHAQAGFGVALMVAQSGTPEIVREHTMDTPWRQYHNKPAGYVLDYPGAWVVHEHTAADGSVTTTFTPPHGGTGIDVTVRHGSFDDSGQTDIPNTRCQHVMLAALPGTRCVDTISFSTSTSVVAHGRTYAISTSGKRMAGPIYDHLVRSFRLTA